MASPNAYAENPPAQANRDDTTKWLRSAALTVTKRRWRHSLATLGTRQRSQAEETPPNRYAEHPSAQSARDSIAKSLRSESLSVARRGKHHQMSTLRTAQHRVIRPRATPNTGRQTQGHPTQAVKHRSPDPRPPNTGHPTRDRQTQGHPTRTQNRESLLLTCAKAHIATAMGRAEPSSPPLREGLDLSNPHKAHGIHSPRLRPKACNLCGEESWKGQNSRQSRSPCFCPEMQLWRVSGISVRKAQRYTAVAGRSWTVENRDGGFALPGSGI